MSNRERLLTLLREKSFAQRDVVLASGKRSNFYLDCKQTTLDPEGASLLGDIMFDQIVPCPKRGQRPWDCSMDGRDDQPA